MPCAQVLITSKSNPHFHHNKIHGNTLSGVLVSFCGFGLLEKNHIYGNLGPGFITEMQGNPTVKHNEISNGPAGKELGGGRGKGQDFSWQRGGEGG